ncbi:MAG: CdaR family protein [Candidatus Hydrogenedentota bacterium]
MAFLYSLEKIKRKTAEFLNKNIGVIITCLFLAFITWSIVAVNEEAEYTINVNLRFVDYSPNLVVTQGTIKQVRINAKGPLYILKKYSAQSPEIELNINRNKPGSFLYKLSADDFGFLENMSVQEINPQEVKIVLAKKLKKTVAVKSDIKGDVNEDYEIESIVNIPSKVYIEGPENIINKIEELKTLSLSIEGIKSNFETNLKLLLPNEFIMSDKDEVRVIINVKERIINRFIQDYIEFEDDNLYKLSTDTVELQIEGPSTIIKELTNDDFIISLQDDIKKPGTLVSVIVKKSPENIKVLSIKPEKIRIMKNQR